MSSDPVILMTGAAGGIGRALVAALRPLPYRLALTDLNVAALRQHFADDARLATFEHDVTSLDSWRQVLDQTLARFNRFDVLANVAGVVMPGYVYETPVEYIDYHVDVNIKGVLYGMRLASEQMVAQGSGHILNIASLAGIAPVPGISLYSASKFAVRGYSLATANELREQGVFVTCISPGLVDTPMLDLQLDYDEAAITFSNGPALRPERVAQEIVRALDSKPVELCIPNGTLPKISSAFPSLTGLLKRIMTHRGQAAMRRLRGDASP